MSWHFQLAASRPPGNQPANAEGDPLLGESSPAGLTVYANGKIINYVPVPEIPPYATLMLRLASK